MQEVRQGSRGYPVQLAQRLLNKNGATPALREDGIFGPKTRAAVVAFQTARNLRPATGIVNRAIFTALGLTVDIEHPIQTIGQPTNMTCWSAAMTMMRGTNMSVGAGRAQTASAGGLPTTAENIAVFAEDNGMRIVSRMQSMPVGRMIQLLTDGPLLVIGAGGTGTQQWAHASVIGGIYSDEEPNASGTMLRIHDPWPPGSSGRVYGVFYTGGVQAVPGTSYNLFCAYVLSA